jgi:hypothetical protein
MKRFARLALLALVVAAVVTPFVSRAGSPPAHAQAKGTMKAQYLVTSPHTAEECLKALDDVSAMGTLPKWQFGCMDGDHTGYLITTATDAQAALAMVPASVRGKARAVKLHTFTPAELKAAHEHMHASK